jgi:hypothetical protein
MSQLYRLQRRSQEGRPHNSGKGNEGGGHENRGSGERGVSVFLEGAAGIPAVRTAQTEEVGRHGMMTVGPRSVPAGTGGSKRDGGAGERSGSERDGGVEEPRNSSSEDDVEVFGDGRDRLRRRGRPRVPRRASWNASFGTQTRALWGGSTGRRRQSWGGAGLTTLLQSPCSQGRVGPVGGSPGQPTSAGQPSPGEVQPSPPVIQANPPEVQPVKRSRRVCLKKNGNWADHQLKAAMAAIDQGCPVQTAALDYEIPRSTLRCHVMGQSLSRKRGRKPVLSTVEEEKLVKYIMGMARYGHPLNITELKIKVAEATQLRETPFKDGIPGAGWLRWFRKRHPEISLRMSQGLDAGRARGLCPSHVATFYDNMELMLTRGYEASHIWNCDESGAQAGRNGGGRVLAKTGMRSVHSVIPKEREWLSVLVCINAAGYHIPSFYIFRGKSFQ